MERKVAGRRPGKSAGLGPEQTIGVAVSSQAVSGSRTSRQQRQHHQHQHSTSGHAGFAGIIKKGFNSVCHWRRPSWISQRGTTSRPPASAESRMILHWLAAGTRLQRTSVENGGRQWHTTSHFCCKAGVSPWIRCTTALRSRRDDRRTSTGSEARRTRSRLRPTG